MKKLLLLFIGTSIHFIIMAQDFTFSQFYEMPLLRNPALAGISNTDIRVQSAYRSQWRSITVPYQTQALSTEVRFPIGSNADFLTTGIQITNDLAGDSKLGRLQLLPVLTFHKSLSGDEEINNYLSFSVMGGLIQSQFDPTKMTFDDQFQNGSFNPGNTTQQVFTKTSLSYGDLSTGLAYSNTTPSDTRFYLGAACYHLLKSKVSFYDANNVILNKRYVFNVGVDIASSFSENDRVSIYGDYILQAGNRQFLAGLLYRHDLGNGQGEYGNELENFNISIGGAYRWADAFIPIVRLDLRKYFFGCSYDVNVSKLKSVSQFRGGFEITAGYRNDISAIFGADYGRTRQGRNSTKCPGGYHAPDPY